ncbi:MAG: pyruvate, phosphate dikinase [Candidatus Wildermuthbacteria bacterium RIFCSPHIGHO2_01_FULL_47_27]|uniref:Pyruvate, phosphate dikinase n=2 Tax=Candidatus Wildermuthiibacteriota TaxID=1817923 RepID=A0A1G2RNB0_9BACT|nr:MAG: pyruvate, phosphate dikinase [Candidatus Wildermuthbacteria bacterium RIFCSPHIGHO2_01_FULL_47_27]OHA66964.1 MAG: pyruvate, phosphate dikinase [Candidatus Wildermuthbacteria bacterium RIFCSPHIGHO2_02_FULL_47_17]OHA73849.1 MAG: pyruvate, phosphate dikinase [Candidatus Wildermuthbacteria bacterium RIFCSPLOWO2_01_FULL_48_35]OHA76537.1 MAG: pyruvate, phosphate dikinase [Candidatus Wildermuthbacteria bacterium RIFCSPLOWO2_02_FULL_47_10]
MKTYVYSFSQKKSEGSANLRNLLGGKGANLAQMAKLDLPVPPGFTISTEVCAYFYEHGQRYPRELKKQVEAAVTKIEKDRRQKFGDPQNPLLFSVRSGARISMPGMMDTVLNLGLNEKIAQGLISATGNPRFAWNSYWRFIFMFADVVMGAEKEELSEVLEGLKLERNYKQDIELSAEDWKETAERLKEKVKDLTGKDVPEKPREQLRQAVGAVFQSWNNPRAITYRKLNKIPGEWGTAVNVQSMVFGNLGSDSGSGVGFTRSPATGEKKLYGEFLQNAQGEDVVAGIRTPQPIGEIKKVFPKCYQELLRISKTLERYFRDMQDIEFTIERGKLWMLQTRGGKRTAAAAVKIALDMVAEKMITRKTALLRVDPKSLESFFRPSFDPKAKKNVIAKGLAASPGAAVGEAVFDPAEAVNLAEAGRKVILVRQETSPDDIHGMAAAEGILTARGGMTSHAALVTRGMGKPCVAGCEAVYVDYKKQQFSAGEIIVKKGETISIDGQSGEVMLGEVPTVQPEVGGDIEKLLRWADGARRLGVRANADTPEQAKQARELGAAGIGLCRTEHMFFEESRIPIFQEMIMTADDEEKRASALEKILPLQKSDFLAIFKEMEGYPVIIRLLDPPLHEFLPKSAEEISRLSQQVGISAEAIKQKTEALKEINPMLGHRGCRLGITYPEIYEMQARAIIEAACDMGIQGKKVKPDIMIPLTMDLKEFAILKDKIKKVCEEVLSERKVRLAYKIGTMIELPRAALLAGEIAKEAEFFSFGTNDLTQTTLGVSRDDAGRFLPKYLEEKIFSDDPFISLDTKGVGELIKIGTERGRKTRKNISVGICGEHGGDPDSIVFSHQAGLDYVSCSPFRVPVARLAAAQAVLGV